ncbi:putative bifunctional diguanylate cyclase/phosphodiesterase [Solirubrobacter soli]|uniref:putative bifunctional diguanylate cyclase/phosphodiesterase n=1 Tax=Solirubrobacter soli TaxID=363832 RepID=UPI00040C06EC|nr:GGDEF and EAL domain-containing protein [Solirubrobacter soli]
MRHRGLLAVLAIHLVLLPAFAVSQGWSLAAGWAFDIGPAVFGALACWPRLGRGWRSSMCAMALLSCSALVVVSWHGTTEAHFHYFVMVGALALYEEWWAYLMAITFVVLQHGVISFWETGAVFNHDRYAWAWAGVHGLFVAALAVANLISWRANESARTATASSEERFRRAFDAAPVAMALVSPAGELLQTNDELRERVGTQAARFWDFAPAADQAALKASWPPESDAPEAEQRYVRADGTLGWFIWRHSLILDSAGSPDHYISQGVDITARKHDAERLDHQAHHDPLTGLPNRALFDIALADALERRKTTNTRLAVLFADIDDFKVINDSLGHRAGDELLVQAAERLTDAVRPGDTIARFGGDEFVILLERIMSLSDLRRVADRVAAEIKRPFVLDGRQRFLSSSIGIAVADGTDVTAEELLRDADAAMYQAKENGKAQLEFFDRSVRSRAVERLELEAELRDALAAGQLSLAYQPEVMLSDTSRMFGVEALLRWQHPLHGAISPARFIPVAEQSGLIVEIGEWVLGEACRQAAAWRAEGHIEFVMAVNLSPRQLSSPQLAGVVETALRVNGLPPSALCLEITESAIMEHPEAAQRILQGLKTLGVRLAIDDFGVGYSSLSHLKYLLPVDVIKIDKSFVDGLLESNDARAIITAIIQLAQALGVTAVAEGVETGEQAIALRDLGCHVAQGYHYSKPVPADYLLFSQSDSRSAASPALSPALENPSPASLKIVRNLSA